MSLALDVAIIGASSAGLYAAELLAQAGRRVAVFERQPDLKPDRRTLIITPQLYAVLKDIPPKAILHTTSVMAVATPGASVQVELHEPDLIIERGLLAHHLEARARQAGVAIHYGHRFTGLSPHLDGARLEFSTGQRGKVDITAQAVIGADGVRSDVARAAALRHPPTVPIVQAEVHLPSGWNPQVTQVWFDVATTRFFYWLIPESEQRGVVGLVGDERANPRMLLDHFLAQQQFVPLAYQAARVAMHHPRLRPWGMVGSAPVLLLGDAAGQVKVTTVGGTVTGFWAAQAAVEALVNGTSYRTALRPLNRELHVHWGIRYLLERLNNVGYDELVDSISHPVRQFLSRNNRDDMARHIWQLLFLQPRFLSLVPRLLRDKNMERKSDETILAPVERE
jgi:flavin-dependent dehydrogenase